MSGRRATWPRRALLLAPLVAPLGAPLAGCTASPEPRLYTLAALPGEARPGGPATIELRRPGLAGYLDRPEIVRAAGPFRVDLAGAERWAEPFGDMLGRVLAENLTQRLPGSTVFTEAGGLSADADAVLELDVQRFDVDAAGQAVLLAQLAVRHSGSRRVAPRARTVRLTVPAGSTATLAVVTAMSGAVAQLADTAAAMLRGL